MTDHLAPAMLACLINYCEQALRSGRVAVRIYPTAGDFNFVFRKFCLEVAPKRDQSGRLRRCRSYPEGFYSVCWSKHQRHDRNGGSKFHRETVQCLGNDRWCLFDLQSLATPSSISVGHHSIRFGSSSCSTDIFASAGTSAAIGERDD